MVYESDFYTTRRPYRPGSSYSSVTVSAAAALLTPSTERASHLAPLSREPDAPRTSSTFATRIPQQTAIDAIPALSTMYIVFLFSDWMLIHNDDNVIL